MICTTSKDLTVFRCLYSPSICYGNCDHDVEMVAVYNYDLSNSVSISRQSTIYLSIWHVVVISQTQMLSNLLKASNIDKQRVENIPCSDIEGKIN